MVNKIIYDIRDICVACGRPARPGEMLCEDCKRKAGNEFYGMIKPENKKEQQKEAVEHMKIGVMLSGQKEQARLLHELQRLYDNAEILGFERKAKLLQVIKNNQFSIIFLSETYGVESGVAIGKRIQAMGQAYCNLIYVTDSTDIATLSALWEMHISGIIPKKFTADEIKAELRNLRYRDCPKDCVNLQSGVE